MGRGEDLLGAEDGSRLLRILKGGSQSCGRGKREERERILELREGERREIPGAAENDSFSLEEVRDTRERKTGESEEKRVRV